MKMNNVRNRKKIYANRMVPSHKGLIVPVRQYNKQISITCEHVFKHYCCTALVKKTVYNSSCQAQSQLQQTFFAHLFFLFLPENSRAI